MRSRLCDLLSCRLLSRCLGREGGVSFLVLVLEKGLVWWVLGRGLRDAEGDKKLLSEKSQVVRKYREEDR